MEYVVGLLSGCLVVGLICYLKEVGYSRNDPDLGKQLPLSELTELVRVITEEQVRGVRSVLGLDLGETGIVEPEDEEEDGPIAFVNELEMDPFMMTEEEWLGNQLGPDTETK